MKPIQRQPHSERGAVIIEFAIILPVLSVLLIGAFEVGIWTMDHQILQNAAREGARYASLPGNDVNNSNATVAAAALNRIRQRVVNYLDAEGITVLPTDVTVLQGIPDCQATFANGTTVGCSEVRVVFSKPLIFPGLNMMGVDPIDLEGRAVFRNLFGN